MPLNHRLLALRNLRRAFPLRYNVEMCRYIQDQTKNIDLPKLSKDEMSRLKHHLEDFHKIDAKGLRYTFLNLRNAFIILHDVEEDRALHAKISAILNYLSEFKYVFDMIIEAQTLRESPMLEKALNLLNLEINKFNMKYNHLLSDADFTMTNFTQRMPTLDDHDLQQGGEGGPSA